jgi:hypothetical protein
MPQNSFIIATKTDYVADGECEVYIFDYSKQPSKPKDGEFKFKPTARLKGHSQEG